MWMSDRELNKDIWATHMISISMKSSSTGLMCIDNVQPKHQLGMIRTYQWSYKISLSSLQHLWIIKHKPPPPPPAPHTHRRTPQFELERRAVGWIWPWAVSSLRVCRRSDSHDQHTLKWVQYILLYTYDKAPTPVPQTRVMTGWWILGYDKVPYQRLGLYELFISSLAYQPILSHVFKYSDQIRESTAQGQYSTVLLYQRRRWESRSDFDFDFDFDSCESRIDLSWVEGTVQYSTYFGDSLEVIMNQVDTVDTYSRLIMNLWYTGEKLSNLIWFGWGLRNS